MKLFPSDWILSEVVSSPPLLQKAEPWPPQVAAWFPPKFGRFLLPIPRHRPLHLWQCLPMSNDSSGKTHKLPPTNLINLQRRSTTSNPASSCSFPRRMTSRIKVVMMIIQSNRWREAWGTGPKGFTCWRPRAHKVKGISTRKREVITREIWERMAIHIGSCSLLGGEQFALLRKL